MNKKRVKAKIRDFYKKTGFSTNEDFSKFFHDFRVWVENQKRTSWNLEILNYINKEHEAFEESFDECRNEVINFKRSGEIQAALEKLFMDNEDLHIGTTALTAFYERFSINYDLQKQRAIHASRISFFRRKLRKNKDSEHWLISGKTMKSNLGLYHNADINGADETIIDGWCYTSNRMWLEDFFKHEIKKYEDISQAYKHLRERWKK